MNVERQRRTLLRHGFIFLFIAPCFGFAIASLPHPRAWLTAHLTAFLTCFVLSTIGLVWRELRLTDGQRRTVLITGYTAAYAGLAQNIFAAIVDLPGPASAPGVAVPLAPRPIFPSSPALALPPPFI